MLYALSTRHKSKIAWMLLLIFYADMVAAGTSRKGSTAKESPHSAETKAFVSHEKPIDKFTRFVASDFTGKTTNQSFNKPQKNSNSSESGTIDLIEPKSGHSYEEDGGDPGQPEMQSFKSIGTDNMVDLFTGDFSYNIPLLDVGGYPVNIFYSSGISMDQEASWVGLGWNINPGTISRNMRGLPDDFDGTDTITKTMSIKEDITVGANVSGKFELVGWPGGPFKYGEGLFYNNYKGLGLEASFGLSISDKTKDENTGGISPTAALNVRFNSQQGATISPSLGIEIYNSNKKTSTGLTASTGYNSRVGIQNLQLSGEIRKYETGKTAKTVMGLFGGSISFAHPSVTPSIRMPISRSNYNLGVSFGKEVLWSNAATSINGYYSISRIDPKDKEQKKPAYGYLYLDKGQKDDNALMDFNRNNDGVYTKNNPVISSPAYTYDAYSISGEGTGGSFRPYRGDVGYIKDHYSKTRDNSFSIDAELAKLKVFEAGINLHAVFSPTEVQEWKTGNLARNAFRFHENDSIYQGVYFRNPSEKTIGNEAFTKALGDDDLVRIKLNGQGTAYPYAMPILERFGDNRKFKDTTILNDFRTTKHQRDKRSQIITYLNAEEASKIGMDKTILSYPINEYPLGGCQLPNIKQIERYQTGKDPLRKRNHISEIDVLNPDGRRYIYGLPVYNTSQEEVTFASGETTAGMDQIAGYDKPGSKGTPPVYYYGDNSTYNDKGKDNYFQKESVPAYAHSFLLTGLLSPDYVDVKGDGITEDDMGDAVKFNYSQIKNDQTGDSSFHWRAPFTKTEYQASFNEGLKTDKGDNKVSYTYGSRELWYLNSIESKNMVATFKLENRWDAKEAKGKDGGVLGNLRSQPGMKLLRQIDLYSKADKLKLGDAAKPIKTVHFDYTFELCQNTPSNISGIPDSMGKLTLKSIWFSYNGNKKQQENRYKFKYHSNPDYNRAANDRWGNYKPSKTTLGVDVNPAGMNNADYPYSVQNKDQADEFAGAWCLNEVQLPSGGKINITYESDDYGYVQNRRAQQMYRIAGMGVSQNGPILPNLYKRNLLGGTDYLYIFIDTKTPDNTVETAKRYFEGITQLYMKLWVTMPPDLYGSGAEPVPVYAEIDNSDYGVYMSNKKYLYVKVKPIRGNDISPMSSCAIQFLRDYLPSKAYPGSDIKLASGPKAVFLALKGLKTAVSGAFSDFEASARKSGKCYSLDVSRSVIRLNNAMFQKLGGGHRVKKVEITDNWEEMTQKKNPNGTVVIEAGMQKSTYGQEYDYTTIQEVDGKKKSISSGVATYEPGIGAEENPFREILRYSDRQPLGPTQNGAVEIPIGEMFYPSPMVGYSKVTVRSVNRVNVKSGVGKQVTEFYTSKDFPVIADFTDFDNSSKINFNSNSILRLLKLDMRQTTTLSQGFRVQLNDMNGKIKTQSSFAEDGSTLITYTANFYRLQKRTDETFKLDNNLMAVKGPDGAVTQTQIGKEVEMMVDFREHTSKTITTNLDINVNVSNAGPIIFPVPSLVPPVSYEESIFRSATLMKIVNQYGILDSVISIDKGSQVTTKDLVYDGETGNVLLTRTNNEFNAPVYNFSYPAHWAYSGMHPAYRNIDLMYRGTSFRHGILINSPQVNQNYFESGDELYVTDGGDTWIDDSEACALEGNSNTPCLIPQKLQKSFEKRIWALDVRKDKANAERSFIFLDRNGKLYNADNVTFRIVRSGKRNMLNESVGTVTSRFSPIITESGQLKIKPQDNNDVLNTAATTFKDHWRVDNSFYIKDSLVQTVVNADVKTLILNIDSTHYYGVYHPPSFGNNNDQIINRHNENFVEAKHYSSGSGPFTLKLQYVSWAFINIDNSLIGKHLISATLNLAPHYELHNYSFEKPLPEVHQKVNPHNFRVSEFAIGTLRRMLTKWHAADDRTEWGRDLLDGDYHIKATSPTVDKSTESIILADPGDISNQQKVYQADITNMLKAMLIDKSNGSPNATAFRMHIPDQAVNQQYLRTAFAQKKTFFNSKQNANTTIEVKYLDCNPSSIRFNSQTNQYQCLTYEQVVGCYSTFTKALINPYVHGILGNWRTERAYTYYGSRRDSAISGPLDLRKTGAINNFKTYWMLNADSLRTVGNESIWVWNSEITQFNKRGFEIENHDPLGRFNSGLYGYSQALPIAVANNAKHREIAFDGFEDYYYSSTPCAVICQPKRHFNITDKTHLDSTEAHTGKFSLRLLNNESVLVTNEVATMTQDTALYSLRINVPKQPSYKTTYNLQGSGWELSNYQPANFENLTGTLTVEKISFSYDQSPGEQTSKIWRGIYVPTVTGTYQFRVGTDDGARLFISNNFLPSTNLLPDNYWSTHGVEFKYIDIAMTAGTHYYIIMHYQNTDDRGSASLVVRRPCDNSFNEIATSQVYNPQRADQIPASFTETLYCVKPDTIQPRGNFLTDTFSMLQGKRMVLSAWVKENMDCHCDSYIKNQISIKFRDVNGILLTSSQSLSFKPSGSIIEGWQRYESEFTVPDQAKNFEMKLENLAAGGPVYFDDIRIHPFNSNLKSFVYHPSNLRLMAELDENNYASFYEYDDDGTLVRVKKETIKGIKTINETRSALQKSVQ